MLSIAKVALGGEDYYLRTAAVERAGLVEAAGEWLGSAPGHLGLVGQAQPRAVRQLLAGRHPAGGAAEPLMPFPERRRVAAYDCTFSTPKSVSLLFALHPAPAVREEVRRAHESAVLAVVEYLESTATAVTVPTADGPRVVMGGEMAAVGFLHRLSRAGDPHLHTHVLIANVVRDPSGDLERGRPLDARSLYHECRTAGALFETHLRYELTSRLGVEWQPLRGWWADLKGIDAAVLREFSQRSEQILGALATEGLQGRAATRLMADVTRPAKDLSAPYDTVIDRCWERAFRAGLSEARVAGVCGRLDAVPEPDPLWKEEALRRAASLSVDGSFTAHDLIRATCATTRGGMPAAGVLSAARDLAMDERLVERGERALALKGPRGRVPLGRSETRYLTHETAAHEDRLLAIVASRRDLVGFVAYEPHERAEALDSLSRSLATWRGEGRDVVALAPGRSAAVGFEASTGIETVVPAGVPPGHEPGGAGRPELSSALPGAPGSVVVLAEAQCYGPAALDEIVQACAARDTALVLFGPRRAAEQRPALGNLASLADWSLPPAARFDGYALQAISVISVPARGHRFGGVDVTLVPSLAAARDEAVRRLSEHGAGGASTFTPGVPRPVFLVVGDQAVASAIRVSPGIDSTDVVHAGELGQVLASRAGGPSDRSPHLVVLGGASVLRKGATASPGVERSHIVVAPDVPPGSPAALGRAAEAARPAYLTKVLGAPASSPNDRQAWRRGAVLIEAHRIRFGITDLRNPFGLDPGSRDQARARAELQRGLEAESSTLGRRIDAPSVGLGR